MTAVDVVLCAVILWFAVRYKNRIALVLGLIQTVGVIYFANLTLPGGAHHMLAEPVYYDQLSVIMVLIVGLVGSAICVYALGYMKDFQHHENEAAEKAGTTAPDRRHFFAALMFLFLAAMFVIVLSDNLEWDVHRLGDHHRVLVPHDRLHPQRPRPSRTPSARSTST